MSEEIRAREAICEVGLSLFSRALTFGSTGNISVRLPDGGWLMTPTNASLGKLDPATLVEVRRRGPARFRGQADQGSLPPLLHVRPARRRPRGRASAFDPFGRRQPARRHRPEGRAAAAHRLFRDAGRTAAACALFSARRRDAGESGRGVGRRAPCGAARQSRAGRRRHFARERPVRNGGARGDGQAVPDAARARQSGRSLRPRSRTYARVTICDRASIASGAATASCGERPLADHNAMARMRKERSLPASKTGLNGRCGRPSFPRRDHRADTFE